MDAKQALKLHRKKRKFNAAVEGVDLGDIVAIVVDDESEKGIVDVIEVFGDDHFEFTVREYDRYGQDNAHMMNEWLGLDRSDISWVIEKADSTPPPKFWPGDKVQVIGDDKRAGAFGVISYAYNRNTTQHDADFGVTGRITGWRYAVDFKGGVNPDAESGESVEEKNLVQLSDQQFADLVGGGDAPEIEGEEDLVIG